MQKQEVLWKYSYLKKSKSIYEKERPLLIALEGTHQEPHRDLFLGLSDSGQGSPKVILAAPGEVQAAAVALMKEYLASP